MRKKQGSEGDGYGDIQVWALTKKWPKIIASPFKSPTIARKWERHGSLDELYRVIEDETVKVGVVFRVDSDLIQESASISKMKTQGGKDDLRMQYQFRIFPYQVLRDRAGVSTAILDWYIKDTHAGIRRYAHDHPTNLLFHRYGLHFGKSCSKPKLNAIRHLLIGRHGEGDRTYP